MLIMRCDYCGKDTEFQNMPVTDAVTVHAGGKSVWIAYTVTPPEGEHICPSCAKKAVSKIK